MNPAPRPGGTEIGGPSRGPSRGARGCCSDLELDQLILGELDEPERLRIEAHVAASPSCAARLLTLRAAQQEWQSQMPPLAATTQAAPPATLATVTSLDAARRRRRQLGAGLTTLAAAAGVLFMVQRTETSTTRTKGGAVHVAVTRDVGGHGEDVFSGDSVPAGSRLHVEVWGSEGVAGDVTVVLASGGLQVVKSAGAMAPATRTELEVDLATLPGPRPRARGGRPLSFDSPSTRRGHGRARRPGPSSAPEIRGPRAYRCSAG